jgi:hypothetical protein
VIFATFLKSSTVLKAGSKKEPAYLYELANDSLVFYQRRAEQNTIAAETRMFGMLETDHKQTPTTMARTLTSDARISTTCKMADFLG